MKAGCENQYYPRRLVCLAYSCTICHRHHHNNYKFLIWFSLCYIMIIWFPFLLFTPMHFHFGNKLVSYFVLLSAHFLFVFCFYCIKALHLLLCLLPLVFKFSITFIDLISHFDNIICSIISPVTPFQVTPVKSKALYR